MAALAIVIGIFVSNKTKTPYEKQVITLYEKENESLAEQQTNPEAGMDEGFFFRLKTGKRLWCEAAGELSKSANF